MRHGTSLVIAKLESWENLIWQDLCMELIIIFVGSMTTVFLLGINSQLVRDQNCSGAFGIAWLITFTNMMYTKTFVLSDSFIESYIASGTGGSIGIVLSILFYRYLERKKQEKQQKL